MLLSHSDDSLQAVFSALKAGAADVILSWRHLLSVHVKLNRRQIKNKPFLMKKAGITV